MSLPRKEPNYALHTIKYLTYQLNGQIGLYTLFLQPYLPVHRTHPILWCWTEHAHCITCSMLNCFFFSTDITQNTPSNHGKNCRCSTFSSSSACTSLGKPFTMATILDAQLFLCPWLTPHRENTQKPLQPQWPL